MKTNKLMVIQLGPKQWAVAFLPKSKKPVRNLTVLPDTYKTREMARAWMHTFRHAAKLKGETI